MNAMVSDQVVGQGVHQTVDEWHKQDVLRAVARHFAQVGGITDEYVRESIGEIRQMPSGEQFDAFDVLYTQVVNGHAHGLAADVLWEVCKAWDQVGEGFSLTPAPLPLGEGVSTEVSDVCK